MHLLVLLTVFALVATEYASAVRSASPQVVSPAVRISPAASPTQESNPAAASDVLAPPDARHDADLEDTDDSLPVWPSVLPMVGEGSLFKTPVLHTTIPKRPRKELVVYTVQKGDNLTTIAESFDIDTDTLIWANPALEEDPDYIVVGDTIVIPPVIGVLHTVKEGDTLESIAKQYKGDLQAMLELDFNHLSGPDTKVISGTRIMVPGGEKPYQPRLVYINGVAVMVNAPRGGGRFMWPTKGVITSFYTPEHRAIDIAAPLGTPIYASDAGVVVAAGEMGTYGLTVIIDHGNGFQTLYAHLSVYYPQAGQNVRRGQAIGKMGSTGKSTGPHLHFAITYQGGAVNPFRYLPQ